MPTKSQINNNSDYTYVFRSTFAKFVYVVLIYGVQNIKPY